MKVLRRINFAGLAVLAALPMLPARAEVIPLPSGMTVSALDVITDAPGLGVAYRFRFVADALDPAQDYATTEADMAHLCRSYALKVVEAVEPPPDAIVITLADKAVPFGSTDPDAVQFFEAYRPVDGDCEWQAF
ncbi:DUF6497 family protein [Palleronia abyssalis]|uniref:Acetolactate synthase n=1 Tax=Palleronia abyssalis TaxID=1501240 RepID=A0A2R8BVT4_9RHOB|nr:DUF6497 family protein [Palleronia abyssalis]SPJ24271.1 hypothetical protein PAA8504_02099 [Palleronia abyssalis]